MQGGPFCGLNMRVKLRWCRRDTGFLRTLHFLVQRTSRWIGARKGGRHPLPKLRQVDPGEPGDVLARAETVNGARGTRNSSVTVSEPSKSWAPKTEGPGCAPKQLPAQTQRIHTSSRDFPIRRPRGFAIAANGQKAGCDRSIARPGWR